MLLVPRRRTYLHRQDRHVLALCEVLEGNQVKHLGGGRNLGSGAKPHIRRVWVKCDVNLMTRQIIHGYEWKCSSYSCRRVGFGKTPADAWHRWRYGS